MDHVAKFKLYDGRTIAANIKARTVDQALRKCDFLIYEIDQNFGRVDFGKTEVLHNCSAPKFGFTTVNTKTGRVAGAKLFELVHTEEART